MKTILEKKVYLLALALVFFSIQSCKSEGAKNEANAVTPAPSPQFDSRQSTETGVPAPSEFNEFFSGTMDDKRPIRMRLERKGSDLTGEYSYIRAGAFNIAENTLDLKGRIEGDGNVTLTETVGGPENTKKTGEFTGKLDGVGANGNLRLRFSGWWTDGKDGKKMPFSLRQLGFDLGDLKLIKKRIKSEDKKLNYVIETSLPQLAGAASSAIIRFNQAVADMVAARERAFKSGIPGSTDKNASQTPGFNLEISHEITTANKDVISVLFTLNEYTGGAHPNTTTTSINYDLNRNAELNLANLFTPNSNYLKVISGYAVSELKKLETATSAEDGAGPKKENFHTWNITEVGLKFTFDPYEVGSYADGPHEVIVPYSALKQIIKTDGPLAQFVR